MAHKKAGGSTQLGRDSIAKRLGVKLFEGQTANPGSILIRQRGSKFRAGVNVARGGDDTLFSTANGIVHFVTKKVRKFNGKLEKANFVHVTPGEVMIEAKAAKVVSAKKSKVSKKSKK